MSIKYPWRMERHGYNEIDWQVPARENALHNVLGELLARESVNANAQKIRKWAFFSMLFTQL